jgi:hypothetical protein
MNAYLSHRSAAEYHNIPFLEAVLPGTDDAAGRGRKTELTYRESAKRSKSKRIRSHVSTLALPQGAVVARHTPPVAPGSANARHETSEAPNAGHGAADAVRAASPELVFLQMASSLDLHRLILLGLQLCAHPPGRPSDALSSKRKIMAFIGKTQGHAGHRKAAQAAKYLADGSWSIMESLAYMILALPNALGGYGLRGAVFNKEIALDRQGSLLLSQQRCFADLYYDKAQLAVEYQSLAHHATAAEQGKDMLRAGVLERQGVAVMQFSAIQLYDRYACRDFAFNLAARLGRRIQIRAASFGAMQNRLRCLLPRRADEMQERSEQ